LKSKEFQFNFYSKHLNSLKPSQVQMNVAQNGFGVLGTLTKPGKKSSESKYPTLKSRLMSIKC